MKKFLGLTSEIESVKENMKSSIYNIVLEDGDSLLLFNLFPSVSQTADGTVYKVSAANLKDDRHASAGAAVIVALYKDGRFVGYESAVYNGEALDISTQTPHDAATVMAWKAFDKLIPLAPAAKI